MTDPALRRRAARGVSLASALPGMLFLLMVAGVGAWQPPAFDQAIADLRSPSTGARVSALRRLAEAGRTDAAVPMAATLLDGSDDVQRAAMESLLTLYTVRGDLRDRQWGVPASPEPPASLPEAAFEAGPLATIPAAVPAPVLVNLSEVMRSDESGRTRVAAAYTLGVLASPDMGPMAAGAVQEVTSDMAYAMSHPDVATREVAARAVGRVFAPAPGQTAPVAIGDALVGAMNDRDPAVREWAMESLGFLKYQRAVQALTDRVSYYGKGDEGTAALHALARVANPASQPIFVALLANQYVPFRLLAIEGLGRLGDRGTLRQIEEAAARSTDPGVALAADFARLRFGQGDIMRIGDGLARPATTAQARVYLAEIARDTPAVLHPLLTAASPALRAAAAQMLGASRHPAEADALEPILSDQSPEVVQAASEAIRRLRAYAAVTRPPA